MPRKNAHSITIKDIAKMAGVSVATVSYVMNGKGNISEDTAALIKKIIKETGYSPNLNSRRLVSGKSFNIHVVTNKDETKVCNMFYYEVLLEINNLLSECDVFKEQKPVNIFVFYVVDDACVAVFFRLA